MSNKVNVKELRSLIERQCLQGQIASVSAGTTDEAEETLGVVLCDYFDAHPDCPDVIAEEGFGWREWAVTRSNDVLEKVVDLATAHAQEALAELQRENEALKEENERVRMSNLDCTSWEKATRFDLMRCQTHMIEQREIIEHLVGHIEGSSDAESCEHLTEAKHSLGMAPCMEMIESIDGKPPRYDSRIIPHGWQIVKSDDGDLVLDDIGRGRRVTVLSRELTHDRGDFLSVVGAFLDDLRTFSRLREDAGNPCIEQKAFEAFASDKGLSMEQHPLHYLFLDPKTALARKTWKAAIGYCLRGQSD